MIYLIPPFSQTGFFLPDYLVRKMPAVGRKRKSVELGYQACKKRLLTTHCGQLVFGYIWLVGIVCIRL